MVMNGNGSANTGEPIAEALRLLDLFASVGAEAFDITHTNLQQEKRGFRPAQSLAQARQSMPYLVPSAARRQNKAQWERSSNLRPYKHLLFLNRPILTNGALPPALKTLSV